MRKTFEIKESYDFEIVEDILYKGIDSIVSEGFYNPKDYDDINDFVRDIMDDCASLNCIKEHFNEDCESDLESLAFISVYLRELIFDDLQVTFEDVVKDYVSKYF